MLPAVNMMQRQALARLSVSALVASLPLLYVSLLRPPPSALPGDTAFWFLMSNCVVAAIVAADDAGTLFSAAGGSKGRDDEPCGDNLSYSDSSGCQPVVGFQDQDSRDAMAPSLPAAFHDELQPAPAAAVNMEGELASSTAISGNAMDDRAPPSLIQGEEEVDDDGAAAASTPRTDTDHGASLVQRVEEEDDDVAIIETVITKKNATAEVEAVITGNQNLVEAVQAEHEDETAEVEWPTISRCSRSADDVLREDDGGKGSDNNLRRAATEGSSSPAAAAAAGEEESEYWELSDEELNRRVEEFIARFNRQMRLQVQQEDYAAGQI